MAYALGASERDSAEGTTTSFDVGKTLVEFAGAGEQR
jgi:hypothetical protein